MGTITFHPWPVRRTEDPHALAAAISGLLADAASRVRLGSAARQRAESAYDSVQAARQLVDLYDGVAGGRVHWP